MTNKQYRQTEMGEIPEDWELVTIGNISRSISETFKFSNEQVVFLNTSDIYEGKVLHSDKSNPKILPGQAKKRIKKNDILFSEIRPANKRFAFIDFDAPQHVVSTKLMVLRAQQKVLPKYLYTLLTYPKTLIDFQILAESRSGTFPQITFQEISGYPVALPSLSEQQQIVDFLFSINQKIEINKQMNITLEEIGKTLFKRWFVDFEFPNEDGKPYKSSGGEIVDSELGKIPKSWKAGYLPDVVKIQKGLSYRGKDLIDEGNCVLVGLKCFERQGGFRVDGIKHYKGEYKKEHLLEMGDLVVAMTDLTQGAEVIGNPALVPFIPNIDKAVASLDVSIIKPTSYLSQEYLYLLLTRQEAQDFLYGYTNGSTVLHLSIKGLYEFKLLIPPQSLIVKFNVLVENIFFHIRKNQHENIILTALKDSLLPRLMSGKLRVTV